MLPMMMIGSAMLVGAGLQEGRVATSRHAQARELNREARQLYEVNRENLCRCRRQATHALTDLGYLRLGILERTIPPLAMAAHPLLGRLGTGLDEETLTNWQRLAALAATLPKGNDGALSPTLLMGVGAFGVNQLLDAAHAQAAAAAVEELATRNTTVKWLGLGRIDCPPKHQTSESCQVLGRMKLGPALALGVLMMAAQSVRDVDAAQGNLQRAIQAVDRMQSAIHLLTGLWRVAGDFLRVLVFLDRHAEQMIRTLADGDAPPDDARVATFERYAVCLRELLNAPLITDSGALTKTFPKVLGRGFDLIEAMGWEDLPPGR